MAKVTIETIANLTNGREAARIINENFAAVAAAIELTLSRDGTAPNQMEADLDLNSQTLSNAVIGSEVVREDGTPV